MIDLHDGQIDALQYSADPVIAAKAAATFAAGRVATEAGVAFENGSTDRATALRQHEDMLVTRSAYWAHRRELCALVFALPPPKG